MNTRKRVITEAFGEKVLAWIWQRQHLKPGLATADGKPLQVVFPGRRNGLGGPDFRRAILVRDGASVRGDVELHLRSSLWQAHGHHRDPAYDGVVLHVVMWDDMPSPICLHSGRRAPTLALAPYVLGGGEAGVGRPAEPCRRPGGLAAAVWGQPQDSLGAVLDSLGEERFRAKVARFRDRLRAVDPSQALYEAVMGALGYSQNQEAFIELARRLPLAEVEARVRAGGWGDARRLILERASFLQGERPSSALPLSWRTQGVRPGNHPRRRVEALVHLLERYASEGWLAGLMSAVERAAALGVPRWLDEAITVGGTKNGSRSHGTGATALLGGGRAGEIAVDVLLPFAFAYGLEAPALSIYRAHAPLEANEITRGMSELLGVGREVVNSACRQQGLIHVFKVFCADRRCAACPLGSGR